MELFTNCILCKFRFSRVDVDQFMAHCRHHNISFNQEFIYAASCLDKEGVEKTLKFMIDSVQDKQFPPTRHQTNGNTSKDVDDEETVLTIDVDVVHHAPPESSATSSAVDFKKAETRAVQQVQPVVKRKRGRPRKVPVDPDDPDYRYTGPAINAPSTKRLNNNKTIKKETSYFSHSSEIHTCNLCGDQVKNLLSHNLIYHKGHKHHQFVCGVCNVGFPSSESLLSHYFVHSNEEKQFRCKAVGCQFASKTQGNLRKHEASVHSLLKTSNITATRVKGISILQPRSSLTSDDKQEYEEHKMIINIPASAVSNHDVKLTEADQEEKPKSLVDQGNEDSEGAHVVKIDLGVGPGAGADVLYEEYEVVE